MVTRETISRDYLEQIEQFHRHWSQVLCIFPNVKITSNNDIPERNGLLTVAQSASNLFICLLDPLREQLQICQWMLSVSEDTKFVKDSMFLVQCLQESSGPITTNKVTSPGRKKNTFFNFFANVFGKRGTMPEKETLDAVQWKPEPPPRIRNQKQIDTRNYPNENSEISKYEEISDSNSTVYDTPWNPVWDPEDYVNELELKIAKKFQKISKLPDQERVATLREELLSSSTRIDKATLSDDARHEAYETREEPIQSPTAPWRKQSKQPSQAALEKRNGCPEKSTDERPEFLRVKDSLRKTNTCRPPEKPSEMKVWRQLADRKVSPSADEPKITAQSIKQLQFWDVVSSNFMSKPLDATLPRELKSPISPSSAASLVSHPGTRVSDSGADTAAGSTSSGSNSRGNGLPRTMSLASLAATHHHFEDIPVFYPKDIRQLHLIANSGQGTVWLASTENHPNVAAKYFSCTDENSVQRVREVVSTLKNTNNANMVVLYGLIYNEGTPRRQMTAPIGYLMENIEDGSLHGIIHDVDQKYSIMDVVNWLRQASFALGHLHRRGIVHRDVKPSNMLLIKVTNTLKICDLGLSDTLDQINTNEIGTYLYMAPEVISRNTGYTELCDVYSLGIALWEMVHRSVPYYNISVGLLQLLSRVESEENFRPEIDRSKDGQLINLIGSCWSQRPSERPTMDEINKIMIERLKKEGFYKANFE